MTRRVPVIDKREPFQGFSKSDPPLHFPVGEDN
jgi:hypothetical protein